MTFLSLLPRTVCDSISEPVSMSKTFAITICGLLVLGTVHAAERRWTKKQTKVNQEPLKTGEQPIPKFSEFDHNKDGEVEESEVEATMTKNAQGLTSLLGKGKESKTAIDVLRVEARKLFLEMDADSSGSVNKKEFDNGIRAAMKTFTDKVTQVLMAAMMKGKGGAGFGAGGKMGDL